MRYAGLKKNTAHLIALFALSNRDLQKQTDFLDYIGNHIHVQKREKSCVLWFC